ncbi:hypothetical protein T4D_3482 [Trichinella pseudospiralis]|uniref:Secreted protein n=1 Tax=Trichinella pseudospiralis TaxID=6337 RepID=A0A0V1FBM1_TRIPS|nr:hypothetical protein T4D_3482 [Trichinella pseudospiralis]
MSLFIGIARLVSLFLGMKSTLLLLKAAFSPTDDVESVSQLQFCSCERQTTGKTFEKGSRNRFHRHSFASDYSRVTTVE